MSLCEVQGEEIMNCWMSPFVSGNCLQHSLSLSLSLSFSQLLLCLNVQGSSTRAITRKKAFLVPSDSWHWKFLEEPM